MLIASLFLSLKTKGMTKENLWSLIDECCNDIFDKNEPLLNVKERLYYTLENKLNFTDVDI